MVVATSPFEECFQFVVWFVVGSEILEAGFPVFCLFFLPKMIFGKTEIQNPRHSNKLFTEKEGSDSPPFQQGK